MSLRAKEFRSAGLRMTIREDCTVPHGDWDQIDAKRGG
jgi:hypothetical protein